MSTEQYLESTPTEGVPVAEGLPEETNGIGDSKKKNKKKNDRDRVTLTTANSLRVLSFQAIDSRQNLEANQSN